MKQLFLILFLAGAVTYVGAQIPEVIHLKNGSVIKCTVLENKIGESVTIKTSDGSIYVYPVDQILKIEKETSVTGGDLSSENGADVLVDIDGNRYKTVQLGDFIWMAENLKTTRYADGSSLTRGTRGAYTPFFYYPDESYIGRYGLLYNWAAAVKVKDSELILKFNGHRQGICPDGWHLPTENEFIQSFGVKKQFPGKKAWTAQIKAYMATSGWVSGNQGTNETGFNALPAGWFDGYRERIEGTGKSAFFWSSTQLDDNSGLIKERRYAVFMNCSEYNFYIKAPLSFFQKTYGLSVRCVKNY